MTRRASVTRRHLQLGLGLLWLLDAALQIQPFMFTPAFSRQVISTAAMGQPGWVVAGVHLTARMMSAWPVATNAIVAVAQLLLAVAILSRRSVRFGLLGSVGWAGAVWYFGEGCGGMASGHASIVTGAPGAVVFYALLAALAWPAGAKLHRTGDSDVAVSSIVLPIWAVVWVGGAVLQLLPRQNSAAAVAASVRDSAAAAPGWLAGADRAAGGLIEGASRAGFVALLSVLILIGLAALAPSDRVRRAAAAGGAILAGTFWIFGQNLGGLGTGQATDPNSGPLLVLLALAVANATPGRGPIRSADGSAKVAHDRRYRQLGLTAAGAVLLTGLVAGQATAHDVTPSMPGMRMPSMSAPSRPAAAVAGMPTIAARPSASALMICDPEIRADVAAGLRLGSAPSATATWADSRYTCIYHLSDGPFVLSETELRAVASAREYFDGLRHGLGRTQPLSGLASLGLPAYQTGNGVVAFLKDDKVLQVDATALPVEVGPYHESRTGFAYQIATDVLACWSGK